MSRIEKINDFVVRFANVNGTGSASANNLFAMAIYRMGVPVTPKNIFPSNIQGLPTWYEVRVSGRGWLARRGGIDLTVAVNGQTLVQDYNEVLPGGYFLYDSTKRLPDDCRRDDLTIIAIPLTQLCNDAFTDPRLRQLLKNIIYIGALARLLAIDHAVLTAAISSQFAKKPQLAESNLLALEIGSTYVRDHFDGACGLRVEPLPARGETILMDGNSALALGAIYAGATVAGWYPITPSTTIVEAFERYANRYRIEPETGRKRFAVIQAEDELAAIGIAIGASWNGARGFTATSGPGLSLMAEFLGLAYYAEIPVVLMDVQRAGPSTGMPTRTQQSDILDAAYASHGDTRHVLLFPGDPKECFEMAVDAFDLADRLQTPIIVMSDLDLGMNDHLSAPLVWDDNRRYDRGKVLDAAALDALKTQWGRYLDVDGDAICYRTYPGTHPGKGAYFTRGTSHNEYSAYTEDNTIYRRGMERLARKWETAKRLMPAAQATIRDAAAAIGAVFYGTTTPAAAEAIDILAAEGLAINMLRLKAFPFGPEVAAFIDRHERILVIEQNRDGQMRLLLLNEGNFPPAKLQSVVNFDGLPITAATIVNQIRSLLSRPATAGDGNANRGERP
ncbi:MAG: 2-oxoacid:acceptor oxidoreductase subunit alpha [Desulfoprunum sp.]|uniref:2-oxoacid:acceptor oxidoreductase subunit alpha n=1 Tax=Desulfoprunum sp. TaxID=2020866 RepID=UPI003C712BD3